MVSGVALAEAQDPTYANPLNLREKNFGFAK
jgi:hypothetical protein